MNRPPITRTTFELWRLRTLMIIIAVIFSILGIRLFILQIVEGTERWLVQSDDNRTLEVSVPAPRGVIYDRNGYVLASNAPSYNIVITPANLPDDDADIQEVYRQLSKLIDVPVNQGTLEDAKNSAACLPGPGIAQLVELGESNAPYSPVKIKCNVDEEIARVIQELSWEMPGVGVEVEPIRNYPTGSLTAAIVGFLGPIPASQEEEYRALGFLPNRDKVGYAGVEAYFQEELAGKPGRRVVEIDVAGQEIRNLQPPIDPVPGQNVYLTIDTRLQAATEASLIVDVNFWNNYFRTTRISSGVIIAMNPKTGEILSMATYPTYENNRLARFIPAYYYQQLSQDPRNPLLNNAIQSEYPPGSVFKLATAIGALNEGVVTLDQIIDAPGQILLTESYYANDPGNQRPFVDWNEAGFGTIDFLRCIAFSSNVCFYKLGGGYQSEIPEGLGILRLGEYARALGYGQPSGIELLGEADGLVPSPQWKRINQGENWSTGDTYIASVGQGYVLSTPLQVLASAAVIANDGKMMQPTILSKIVAPNGQTVRVQNPVERWNITTDNMITEFDCEQGFCIESDNMKNVDPWVVEQVQNGMRLAVTTGTLQEEFAPITNVAVAGKTGTAEYCDNVAQANNRCEFGNWPTHSWTVAYAPFEDPEIVVVAFAYNGGEGAAVAGPMVRRVLQAYFKFKAIDLGQTPLGDGG